MLLYPALSEASDTLRTKNFRHEAGISTVNLAYYHGNYIYDGSNVHASYMNGFYYKYQFKKNYALRLATVLNYKDFELPSDYLTSGIAYFNTNVNYYYEGMIKSMDLRVGMERDFGKRRLKPFLAIDFQYIKSVEEGQEHWTSNAFSYRLPRDFRHEFEAIGAGLFLGVKYDVNSKIRLSSEIGFIYQRYIINHWMRQRTFSQTSENPEITDRKVGSFTNFLPGRLINIAFLF